MGRLASLMGHRETPGKGFACALWMRPAPRPLRSLQPPQRPMAPLRPPWPATARLALCPPPPQAAVVQATPRHLASHVPVLPPS
eukprot:scaffold80120_cov37-Tisochrysis_lutea.AAC.5